MQNERKPSWLAPVELLLASAYLVPPTVAVQLQFTISCCCDSSSTNQTYKLNKETHETNSLLRFSFSFLVNLKALNSHAQPALFELALATQVVVWVELALGWAA